MPHNLATRPLGQPSARQQSAPTNARQKRGRQSNRGGDRYTLTVDSLAAPGNSPGKWLPRDGFKGNKSFGLFQCTVCLKTWTSAHAFRAFTQGCKTCDTEELPLFMWENSKSHTYRDDEYDAYEDEHRDEDKAHDRERCEACRRGMCIRRRGTGLF